jgi:two-component sensor histidine kinase
LIINELLTNAVKHAFRDRKKGKVWVKVCTQGNMNNIEVSDNGCGLPEKFDIKNLQSFGLKLVSTLSGQLKAQFSAENKNGSVFKLTFPAQKSEFKEN